MKVEKKRNRLIYCKNEGSGPKSAVQKAAVLLAKIAMSERLIIAFS